MDLIMHDDEMLRIDRERDQEFYNDNNVFMLSFKKKKKRNKRKKLEERIWD